MNSPISDFPLMAVCGRPVAHSRGPDIFSYLLRETRLPGRYLRIAVDDAAQGLRIARQLPLRGFNVTAPFKRTILPLLEGLDEASRKIGAVNTVVHREDGWHGANTDHIGVSNALKQAGVDPGGRDALVLGAGGAGRAAVFGLLQSGAREVTLINRTPARATTAAGALGCSTAPWSETEKRLSDAEIIVSCLPAGVLPPGAERIRMDGALLDAEYSRGAFAEIARRKGSRVVDGLAWLVQQALPAFRLLTGTPISDEMVSGLRELMDGGPLSPGPHLALIGGMGAGKSSVGLALAERCGLRFLDTDSEIERESGQSIREIFSARGESGFRELERIVTRRELSNSSPALIALGGGAVLDPENRALISRRCRVIWLWAPAERTLERIDPETRPLLAAGSGPESNAQRILQERIPLYAALSDLVIDSDNLAITKIAERIANEIDIPIAN